MFYKNKKRVNPIKHGNNLKKFKTKKKFQLIMNFYKSRIK